MGFKTTGALKFKMVLHEFMHESLKKLSYYIKPFIYKAAISTEIE